MPLRDHFRPPLSARHSWEEVHGGWPMMMVLHLAPKLPPQYEAAPGVHIGDRSGFATDVASFERDEPAAFDSGDGDGGVATLVWAPPEPTLVLDARIPDPDVYEVRVYDAEKERRLVAAVELVSPSNKDRPDARQLFVDKVAGLLSQDVCVSIVDVVTDRLSNLYAEVLQLLDRTDPMLNGDPPAIYAVTMRRRTRGKRRRPVIDTWFHPLVVGQPLPTLHLWLSDTTGVTLDLEATYEDTCRPLKIR
jgi:hypothetical protein